MTLNQILYFQKIAIIGNMGRAALALHISQPSLSIAISKLEDELNIKLFHRNGHNLEITDEGRLFLSHANVILADLRATKLHMQALSADRNIKIRIGCISPLLWDFLPRVIRSFLLEPQNKDMKLDFQSDNTAVLIEQLRNGYCDFLICSENNEEGIFQEELMVEPFVLLCPQKAEIPKSWEELFAKGVIGFQEQTVAFYEIYNMLSPHGIEPEYVHIAPDEHGIASLVAHGFGYGIVPNVPFLKNYDVKVVPLPQPNKDMVRRIYITRLTSHPPVGAAKHFLRYLKNWVAKEQVSKA
ncbi:MAG: LysR family transcriptional regulator [Succinatimonas sp.]|nr:LysR family transcriptional regulator [Succinatimonas sp.]